MATAIITEIGLQHGTDRTVYAKWNPDLEIIIEEGSDKPIEPVDHYSVIWRYATGNGVAFEGSKTTTKSRQSVYNAPSNATSVSIVVKPIAKTYKVNKKKVPYFTGKWSTKKYYKFKNNPPAIPPVPSVVIDKYTLTAEVNIYDANTKQVAFQVVKDNKTTFKTGKVKVVKNHASFSCTITAGAEYKVRCRGINILSNNVEEYGGWSEYSQGNGTIPSATTGTVTCKALSSTSVRLDWTPVANATSYEIEYTTNKSYFNTSSETHSMSVTSAGTAIVTGLESGEEWFFRVRAVNEVGSSGWSSIASIVLGKKPSPPTTWSETTTVSVGDTARLYWVHNSEDGSSQVSAEIEVTVNGVRKIYTKDNTADEDDKDKTSYFDILTDIYTEGAVLKWRVRTKGLADEFSDWSIQRTINVYAPPTLSLEISRLNNWMTDSPDIIDVVYPYTLTAFPFFIAAKAEPDTQMAVGYYLTIVASQQYETTDHTGESKIVNAGQEIYSKYFNAEGSATYNYLFTVFTPSDINLENNVYYTANCKVAMDSGLTAEASVDFTVAWIEEEYHPDAQISVDKDTVTTSVRPFCIDANGNFESDVKLSLYRREFDGTFTELATELDNTRGTFVTDPHPALDYARYRVVATSTKTGNISYSDIPGYPVGEIAVVIQWDEKWKTFDVTENGDELVEPPWSGSLLRLPYNIDVSNDHQLDVGLVDYIGRKHPVSYYGTQLGETATWNVEIDKRDVETLYALRRLAVWMGDAYVREPSGSGYWAQISVSFSQKHRVLTIPVTLNITRVEGGA